MKTRFLAILVIAMVVQSCVTGQRDMQRIMRVMERENPADYEKVLKSFVSNAIEGDADAMVALTSDVTIARMGGPQKMKEHYLKDKIPAFRAFPIMTPGGENRYLPPRNGSVGWAFDKAYKSRRGEERRFQIIVLKEQGKIRVAGAGVGE